MAIVNWKKGLYSMQTWGKIGFPCGFGEMLIGDNFLGYFNEHFGVYQRRKGRKKRIIVKQIYCRPFDPQTPKQLASRYYVKKIHDIYKELSNEEMQILEREAKRLQLNTQQVHLKGMQIEKPTQIGILQIGYSVFGNLHYF